MSTAADPDQSKAELQAIIASGIFAKAPNLALLLEYVCSRYFDGQADQIKEYNIAVEALGRSPAFDPRQDSIVRVEAFRLRKRLKQYYEKDGAGHALRIVIPPGQYVPQFQENTLASVSASSIEPDESAGGIPVASPSDLALAPQEPNPVQAPAVPTRAPRWIRLAALVALPVLIAVAALIRSARPQPATELPAAPVILPAPAESEEIRILAGSSAPRYLDHSGNLWSADRFFHGGTVFDTPGHRILGTPEPELFRTRREGEFSYDIPLKPGVYELHLYFAETLFGENNTAGGGESSRIFRVSLNGALALPSFDVISDAGGASTADERVFKNVSPDSDGMLHVRFAPLYKEAPFLNAIEILPGVPGKMRPVRIVAGTRNLTDRRGRIWLADRYYTHGATVTRSEPVSLTTDPELFNSERFGNFVYSIPAAEGHYAVTLRFAETWFGTGKPGGGGVGSRLFDVYCNGTSLLRNFDLYRTAGGPQRAVEKTFHAITPNAQGKIVLSFVPVLNYACINAIEIVDESN